LVRQMEKDGLVSISMSPWGSPAMLVKKHDGSKRVVVDMRKINELLEDEVFPSPTLQEVVDKVADAKAKIYSLIDLRAAYNQIVIEKESRKYTAFQTTFGKFEYCRLPFGLKLSGNFFNYLVNDAIRRDEILARSIITFVDDLFIFTQTLEQHLDVMERLFKALRRSGLKIHNKNCNILKKKVHFIGHIFGEEGVETEPGKRSNAELSKTAYKENS